MYNESSNEVLVQGGLEVVVSHVPRIRIGSPELRVADALNPTNRQHIGHVTNVRSTHSDASGRIQPELGFRCPRPSSTHRIPPDGRINEVERQRNRMIHGFGRWHWLDVLLSHHHLRQLRMTGSRFPVYGFRKRRLEKLEIARGRKKWFCDAVLLGDPRVRTKYSLEEREIVLGSAEKSTAAREERAADLIRVLLSRLHMTKDGVPAARGQSRERSSHSRAGLQETILDVFARIERGVGHPTWNLGEDVLFEELLERKPRYARDEDADPVDADAVFPGRSGFVCKRHYIGVDGGVGRELTALGVLCGPLRDKLRGEGIAHSCAGRASVAGSISGKATGHTG